MGPADARGFSPSGAQAPAVAGVQEQGRQLCRYFSLRTERPSELSWGSWGAGGASRAAFSAATRAGGPGHRSSPQLFPLLVVSPSLNPAPISTPHKHPCFSVCARPVLGSGDTAGEGCLWLQPSRTLAGGHRGDQLPAAGEALWGPWEGLGPPSPPPTPALGVLQWCPHVGVPAAQGRPSTGSARRTGDPSTQTRRGPSLPASLGLPRAHPFFPGSACSPPGAGAAVALAGAAWASLPGEQSEAVSEPGVSVPLDRAPLPSSTPHGPSLSATAPGPAWAAGTGRRGLHECAGATITIRANSVLQSQDA